MVPIMSKSRTGSFLALLPPPSELQPAANEREDEKTLVSPMPVSLLVRRRVWLKLDAIFDGFKQGLIGEREATGGFQREAIMIGISSKNGSSH